MQQNQSEDNMNEIEQVLAALPAAVALLAHNKGLATPLTTADVVETAYQLVVIVQEENELGRPADQA